MDGFTFYISYAEAAQYMKIEERRQFVDALVCCAFDYPMPDDLVPDVRAMLRLSTPTLNKSKTKSENRKKIKNQNENETAKNENENEKNKNESVKVTSDRVKSEECRKNLTPNPFLAEPVENSVLEAVFEILWVAFPKSTKKPQALKLWRNLEPEPALILTILEAVEDQKRSLSWSENDGRYIPSLTTWLTNQRWNDSLPSALKKPKDTPEHILEARKLLGLSGD